MTKLLVISGPIAAGKSSVANLLAVEARAAGRPAAVVDLDRVYMMLDDRAPMSDRQVSRKARRAVAALVDHFVLNGIELVIVEGTFWTESERYEFTSRLTIPVALVYVTLRVSVEEALRRVQADTGRRASRNPAFLRASHAEFDALAAIATDMIIDSTSLALGDVAAAINAVWDHAATA